MAVVWGERDARSGGMKRAGRGIAAVLVLALCACSSPPDPEEQTVVRVGETRLSLRDFESRFLISRMGGDPDELEDPASRAMARNRFMGQLVEELLVLERGRELGMRPDPAKLARAVKEVSEGYPPGAFEEVFARQAVRESAWMRAMESRVMVEEVIRKEVGEKVQVSDEEITAFLQRERGLPPGAELAEVQAEERAVREAAGRMLLRRKEELAYRKWLAGLKERYVIEIHRELLG